MTKPSADWTLPSMNEIREELRHSIPGLVQLPLARRQGHVEDVDVEHTAQLVGVARAYVRNFLNSVEVMLYFDGRVRARTSSTKQSPKPRATSALSLDWRNSTRRPGSATTSSGAPRLLARSADLPTGSSARA
ncbi:2-succinyl-5-enolpyruvyl-6-hydroxy-3-cyclohexene-1-carboxylate synthase [Frankliniella fusca]|uniref:2-succinyl-5-enolpyruvyl-6-hydroxy-3-cyclohexene-1-carboxylate synthase n=1 Tax=Frankliniella fusca TaxID=407009 RepID=A0AAE1HCR6_9NEOP|nr:2-succinyl-5-enolpyruvyl-6-hydroxy-3-cyclohexene-1-carboxylate synthase [Frankliniella fusca]